LSFVVLFSISRSCSSQMLISFSPIAKPVFRARSDDDDTKGSHRRLRRTRRSGPKEMKRLKLLKLLCNSQCANCARENVAASPRFGPAGTSKNSKQEPRNSRTRNCELSRAAMRFRAAALIPAIDNKVCMCAWLSAYVNVRDPPHPLALFCPSRARTKRKLFHFIYFHSCLIRNGEQHILRQKRYIKRAEQARKTKEGERD
jgi:hypothetical protein